MISLAGASKGVQVHTMATPPVFIRGGIWCADLRTAVGDPKLRRVSLGLPAAASPVEVGMALQRKLEEVRVQVKVRAPLLPGLERPGLRMHDLVDLYLDARADDHATKGGRAYVYDYAGFVRNGLGHLTVEDLAGKLGTAALKEWRGILWGKGWGGRSVRNALNMAMAILAWGQDDGRELSGPLPRRPKRFAQTGKPMADPRFEVMTEVDFRSFREHWADEGLHWGSLAKWCAIWRVPVQDYVASRRLYLSLAFYTGAHPEDLNAWKGEDLSVDVGRYTRHNTKSARCVRPAPLDMPEQLQLDCEAELRRRGILRFPPDELVAGGPWVRPCRSLGQMCARLWPDGSRPRWTFQLARRSCVWEYTVRGWSAHEISIVLGHVDDRMVQEVYRRCSQLGIISPVRVPWAVASGPHGGPSRMAPVLPFRMNG
jgi:hypothetical protein